jgi:hypothetical protein
VNLDSVAMVADSVYKPGLIHNQFAGGNDASEIFGSGGDIWAGVWFYGDGAPSARAPMGNAE